MSTLQLLRQLRALDIKVWADGENLRLNAPQGALTPELRARLAAAKEELIALLRRADHHRLPPPSLHPQSRSGPMPLSFAQERLWILAQLEPESASYNIANAVRLQGILDRKALARAVAALLQRHESLRTTFVLQEEMPAQVVGETAVSVQPHDLTHLPPSTRRAAAERLAVEVAQQPFDLAAGPLLRLLLIRLDAHDHVLLYTMHHIISDGWSMGIFVKELATLYRAFAAGKESALPALPLQYADFAHWQRRWLQGDVLDVQLDYWRQQLARPPVLQLPTDYPRPLRQTFNGARFTTSVSAALTAALQELSRAEDVTLFMLLLAAFQVLLYRYSGDEDICVGTPVANRTHPDLEGIIGFFVNTLVLRTDLSGNPSLRTLLARVREAALAAYTHQDVPFEKLVSELQPRRDLSRSPLFQVMFVLQNAPVAAATLPELEVTPWSMHNGTAKFDLLLSAAVRATGELALSWEYNTDLFAGATVQRMAAQFETLLSGLVAAPQQAIGRLPLLPAAERQQILAEWNDTAVPPRPFRPVHQMVAMQAAQTPQAAAVVAPHGLAGSFPPRLSYANLNARANQLAHFLQDAGVGSNDLVAIAMERSVAMTVAVLGVLKAGAAYVPLDPAYPPQRLAFMLRDTAAPVLLTQSHLRPRLPLADLSTPPLLVVVDEWEPIAAFSTADPPVQSAPDDLIYVIYTSGSTGRPKGVMLPHRALSNLVRWQRQQTEPGAGAYTLQFASLSFDVSCQEMFVTWAGGDTLVLVDEETRREPAALLRYIEAQQVTRLFLPYVALRQIADVAVAHRLFPRALREVITAGEPLQVTPALVDLFTAVSPCRLVNQYGPSETHVVTAYTLPPDPAAWSARPPIGKPVANTQVYLLDKNGSPVPVGAHGELVVGGIHVARGYLNRPQITAARFVPRPPVLARNRDNNEGTTGAGRLYRTGDIARYLPDGSLAFLGRADAQVKVRGFRVEPGEVEVTLVQQPDVRQAAVLAEETPQGDRHLVAYVVGAAALPPDMNVLRNFLAQRLPDYMIPARFVFLPALPQTPSGKVDRRALLFATPVRGSVKTPRSAPRTETERVLVQLWEKLLDVQPVGVEDDFFALGGHSLLAVRLFLQIADSLRVNLPVATLFQAATIRKLAQVIDQHAAADNVWRSLVPIQTGGERPPLFCVHGGTGDVLWFWDLGHHLGPEQPFYGLQSRGLDGVQSPLETVAEMAAHYLAEIRSVQPDGPYYLGGYCFGGVIAYEMAQQLLAAGEEVALLAIVSSTSPQLRDTRQDRRAAFLLDFLGNVPRWLVHLRDLGADGIRTRALRRLRVARNVLAGREFAQEVAQDIIDDADQLPPHRQQIVELNQRALREYRLQAYPGRVLVVQPRTPSLFRVPRRGLGWDRVAKGGVTARVVPGSHQSMFKEPHVRLLARRLRGALDRAWMEAENGG